MNARSISLVALVSLTACGRIGYDARDAATTPTMDGGADARADLDGDMQDGRMPMPDADPMQCPRDLVRCGDQCVNLRNDNRYCASCSTGCPIGSNCVDAACVPATNAPAGTECMDSETCGMAGFAPAVCLGSLQGWPNGHCTNYCRSPADCLATEHCVDVASAHLARHPEAQGACYMRCNTPGQRAGCNPGYTCTRQRDGFAVCTAGCESSDAICGANACDEVTGQCFACMVSAQCRGGGACEGETCRCTATTDCGLFARCDVGTGRCGCANDLFCAMGMRCNPMTGECYRP
jgi:hypothetical protein